MKPSKLPRLAPAVLWLALTPCNSPAQGEPPPAPAPAPAAIPVPIPPKPPRFLSSGTALLPDTVLDIDFPASVIPADKVNTEHDLIKTDPAIPGKGIWTSRTTARFTFTEAPPPGTPVKFSIAPGHRYEDGTAIPAGEIGVKSTPAFKLESWPYLQSTEREPVTLLIFNDAVSAATAGPFLTYSDGFSGRLPAKAGPLYYKDAPQHLTSWLGGRAGVPWADRWKLQAGEKPPERKPDDIVPNVLVVRPHGPLPTADRWRIEVMAGLPNTAGTTRTSLRAEAGNFRVAPLQVTGGHHTATGTNRVALHVSFSRAVPKEGVDWKQWVKVEPAVQDLKISCTGAGLTLESSEFTYRNSWTVIVRTGLTSTDGLATEQEYRHTISPVPDSPDLSLPSWDTAQLAAGTRTYRIHSKNMKSVRVRVKSLSAEDALRTLRAYASVKPAGQDDLSGKPKATDLAEKGSLPWSIIPGRTVLDRTWTFDGKFDVSCPITLNWTELLGAQKTPGILFVSAEGDTLPDAVTNAEDRKQRLAQAMVQLTDIGLAWKLNSTEALLYAFSLETGKPLAGTKFTLHDKDGTDTATLTADNDGLCRVPRVAGAVLLTANRQSDQFTVAFDRTLPRESLWRFPVEVDWNPAKDFRRKVMMFTDRGLYRPGETVHLKGIVRKRLDTDLRLADEREAQFTVLDSDQRPLVEKKITLSDQGTFSETVTLPASKVGHFTMRLEFPRPAKEGPQTPQDQEDEREGEFEGEYVYGDGEDEFTFNESFRVEEFRRNTFEIAMTAPQCPPGTTETEIGIAASYLMGQHLSDARVRYYVNATATGFYPEGYREFYFGDHLGYDPGYWAHYYGWADRHLDEDGVQRGADSQSGEAMLNPDGKLQVPVVLPKPEFPSSHDVRVSAEVTDVNQQTLSESAGFTVHPSAVHLGIARNDSLLRTGKPVNLQLLAVTSGEKPVTRDLPVHVKVEQEIYDTVQVETSSGFTQTRSDMRRVVVREEDVTLPAGSGVRAMPFAWNFTPESSGAYVVEVRATDEGGRVSATRTRFYCYGAGDYAWEYEQGDRIRLVPEKKSWLPGQTARVLVMTPIEGTALVTLERANVVRAFTVKLTPDNPVLEIPLTDADAPNVYVSVAVIKGLADNRREVKEPVLKLGYCQLVVENTADDLTVEVTAPRPSYRPGVTAELTGLVKTSDGQPAAGAEVTLWAVDEGVLSVMGYENPDPQSEFMPLLPLSVRCGTSLDLYLPEDADQRWYVNKGFLIGDGGQDPGNPDKLRKNFNPLAFWQADLKTGADGRYRAQFTVPDTLTRYRVLALAVSGPRAFGLGTGSLTVNKPLMLEPVVPRFASVGDVLVPKAVLHNTSPWKGTFTVSLECGAESKLSGGSAAQQIELAAGETKSLIWNVQFTHYGDAAWRWRAEPLTLPAECTPEDRAELTDLVESRFPVKYPGPLLSERREVVLSGDNRAADLLSGFHPGLTARATRIEVDLSRSRFHEAAEAMEYLLTYPYGCVEQTSSSTMPWLAVKELKGLLPKLSRSDAEIARMIQAGADRLLTMRTDSGGLAYWPDSNEANLWGSCWGGLTLLRCRDHGAAVPQEAVDGLTKWLSGEVRRLFANGSPENYQHAAAALCTLAWAGKPEQAWHSKLYEQRTSLSRGARLWLALAMAKSGGSAEQSLDLLSMPAAAGAAEPHIWFSHGEYATALQLFVWCHVAPKDPLVEAALVALTGVRGRQGHWHTTYNNAWAMNALAAYAAKVETAAVEPVLTLGGLTSQQWKFTAENPARFLDLKPRAGEPIALAAAFEGVGSRLYASVKLTGQPELLPMREVDSGLGIARNYQRLTREGKPEPLGEPNVGDLVLVTLTLHVPGNVHYIAVDDPLPCTFEAVNSDFKSQSAASAAANAQAQVGWRQWVSNHEELRDDRALFFCDYVYGSRYEIRYLARVTGVGEATAAQAKIEAMYEPEKYGLSASERVKTLPRKDGDKNVAEIK
jgi:uncharacterized protein YfaS (alpha-2-macroglobulin family)